ncbi:unnamed protein product [Adineta ricciae]|uniref:arylamine N-acetyltransferase n=1 Tax=Adineta ricciae TaxID=249248 RepID=A0A816E562_ADIRI|nr:unnamed protein product [Adineta ricciae]
MENDDRVDEYLKRIDINRPEDVPDEEYLAQLHVGHLTHIPFETFDLIDIKQLNIEQDQIFRKLVQEKRGGVCCEMNGLFAFILQNFNYKIEFIPCGVYAVETESYSDLYTHIAMRVTTKNGTKYLCDVGFSVDPLTPLYFQTDCVQYALNGFYQIIKSDDQLYYQLRNGCLKNKNDQFSLTSSSLQTLIVDIDPERIAWRISYRFPIDFDEKTLTLQDFKFKCPSIVHSPGVILNHQSICHIHTYQPTVGAYSLNGKKYSEWIIQNGHAIRKNAPSSIDEKEVEKLLQENFNLNIERKIELVDSLI